MPTWKTTAALAAGLCLVAGCAGGEESAPPTIGDDGSTSAAPPSSASTEGPGASPVGDFDDRGHEVFLAEGSGPRDGDARELADAWLAYWRVRMDAFAGPSLDPAALGEVAQGEAAEQVISYVRYLQDNDLRTRGDVRLGVGKVRVRGERATMTSCGENLSVDVRANGRPAEPLQPYYTVRGVFQRVGEGGWVVTDMVRLGTNPC